MIDWFKPFVLDKLEHINLQQPYIDIIELKNNRATELVAKEYIQANIELNR
ncbi:MAG: hypothetical protein KAJ63_14065 [Methyloprofundus sp.]|nr:hypothetical protein [Methyloprofundus sp.]